MLFMFTCKFERNFNSDGVHMFFFLLLSMKIDVKCLCEFLLFNCGI